jgi:hypothetical protein
VKLEIDQLEGRFFPGQTAGMFGWGLVGSGLSVVGLDAALTSRDESTPRHFITSNNYKEVFTPSAGPDESWAISIAGNVVPRVEDNFKTTHQPGVIGTVIRQERQGAAYNLAGELVYRDAGLQPFADPVGDPLPSDGITSARQQPRKNNPANSYQGSGTLHLRGESLLGGSNAAFQSSAGIESNNAVQDLSFRNQISPQNTNFSGAGRAIAAFPALAVPDAGWSQSLL